MRVGVVQVGFPFSLSFPLVSLVLLLAVFCLPIGDYPLQLLSPLHSLLSTQLRYPRKNNLTLLTRNEPRESSAHPLWILSSFPLLSINALEVVVTFLRGQVHSLQRLPLFKQVQVLLEPPWSGRLSVSKGLVLRLYHGQPVVHTKELLTHNLT